MPTYGSTDVLKKSNGFEPDMEFELLKTDNKDGKLIIQKKVKMTNVINFKPFISYDRYCYFNTITVE